MAGSNRPSALQLFPWPAMVAAVKRSVDFQDFDAFYRDLPESLPQNSPQTRQRVASLIVRRCFPDRSLNALPTLAWRFYQREDLLVDLMRVTTLEAEPVIARFVVEHLLALAPGDTFNVAVARDFVSTTFGAFKVDAYRRLLISSEYLGFLGRQGTRWFVKDIGCPADALLLLIHARLAPTPRIVRVADILAASFWRYLGMRTPDEVRSVLRDADAAHLIARYARVDELEQVTTCYSFEEYLSRRLAL